MKSSLLIYWLSRLYGS